MFRPYPKSEQLKKPGKKEKKLEAYKGRTIPTKKQRGKVSKKDYDRAIQEHGDSCYFCGSTVNLEVHHVMPKGYSRFKNGRGVWRNLRLLCSRCHRGKDGVHQNQEKMEHLQKLHEQLYGPYFYFDRFDLFKMGLIVTPTEEEYEKFMECEAKRARRKSLQ